MMNKEYAGFWIRTGAALIDLIIMIIVIYVPLSFIYGADYWLGDKWVHGFWDLLLAYVLPVIATIWFWIRYLGTPGKMATNLEVVDAKTGNKLSLGQAIGRYFAYILAFLPLGLGVIWVGIDKKKQGWHDKLAGSVVIKSNEKEAVKFEQNV